MKNILILSGLYNRNVLNYIKKHKNNYAVLFCFIDIISMELLKREFDIKMYYDFETIIQDINNYNIIDLYTKYKYITPNKIFKKPLFKNPSIKIITDKNYFTWIDYYTDKYNIFVFNSPVKDFNIPLEIKL